MKLSQLAASPQLTQITIDTPEIQDAYGEPVEFWILDRQPMSVFIKMATINSENFAEVVELMRDIVKDESGNNILPPGTELPADIWMAVVQAVVDTLGKAQSQTTAA